MRKHLLKNLTAFSCAVLLFSACKEYNPAELVNCEKAALDVRMNGQYANMKILSATLLRTESQLQKYKLLSLEAYTDTMRVVMNVTDGPYSSARLASDSLQLKTYIYNRMPGRETAGKVVLAVKNQFLTTDSAAVTITEADVVSRTVTGTYYIRTTAPERIVSGAFTKVCFNSIQ